MKIINSLLIVISLKNEGFFFFEKKLQIPVINQIKNKKQRSKILFKLIYNCSERKNIFKVYSRCYF
jgi:hypothetical protein